MLYFEEICLQLYSYMPRNSFSFSWAASEGSPPLTLGTPVSVITIWQSSKGQVNGLTQPPHIGHPCSVVFLSNCENSKFTVPSIKTFQNCYRTAILVRKQTSAHSNYTCVSVKIECTYFLCVCLYKIYWLKLFPGFPLAKNCSAWA